MEFESFWPPRRTFDRIASEYYQRRNPSVPWLTRGAIEALTDLLRSTDSCLEWGAGKSTAWVGSRVQRVVSVEHDPVWFERVQNQLAANGLDRDSVRLLSVEPNDRPGDSPYVRAIDEFGDGQLDVVFIDGEHRAVCALEAIPKLASGGVLIIDDVQSLLDHRTSSPHSRWRLGPVNADWEKIAGLLRDWRLIWTSDGFSDTAIWIKP